MALTISGTNSRSASVSLLFNAIATVVTETTFNFRSVKISRISPLTIISRSKYIAGYSSSAPIELLWTLAGFTIINPTVAINSFPQYTFTLGSVYTLQLSVTGNFVTSVLDVYIRINRGAKCDATFSLGATSVTPRTLVTYTLDGCVDEDNEDYPLTYGFSYTKNSKTISLKAQTAGAFSYVFRPIISGTYIGFFTVCDQLSDCTKSTADELSVGSRARNLKEDTIYDQYQEDSNMFEIIEVISNFLSIEDLPVDLIDTIWEDFMSYFDLEGPTLNNLDLLQSMLNQFMDDLQLKSLTYDRLNKYVTFAISYVSQLEVIYEEDIQGMTEIANRVLDISTEISYVQLSANLINKVNSFYSSVFAAATTQNTAHLSVYKAQNFVSELSLSPIVLGNAKVTVSDISVPEGTIVDLEIISFNQVANTDIVYISMKSHETYVDGELIDQVTQIDCSSGCAEIQLPLNALESADCALLTPSGWSTESCKVKSVDQGVATFEVYQSGLYTLVKGKSTATSTSLPLYIVISFVLLAALSVPFMVYFDKTSPYLSVASFSVSTDSRSDRNVKFPTELEMGERNESIFFSHLLISLSKSKASFTRSKRILLLVANIILAIFIQNCIMAHVSLNPALAGLISVCIVLPITAIVTALFSGVGSLRNSFGILILGAMYVTSIVGMFLVTVNSGWLIAMLAGFASEILGAQTLIMLATRALRT